MIKITKYRDEEEDLRVLWLRVSKNIPYTENMDRNAFRSAYLENAMAENVCFLAREGKRLVGAAAVHIYAGWGAVLQLWVPHDELGDEKSDLLLDRTIKLCKEEDIQKISPKPLLGSPAYIEFFKSRGFTVNEEYPEGLWMVANLAKVPNPEVPEGVIITFTDDLEKSGDIEGVARLDAEIAREQLDLEVDVGKNIRALRDEMLEENVVYGIAKVGADIVGYSRTIFADLLSGENIVKNRGLAVGEKFRNRGIGEAVLVASMKMVKERGKDKMYISTHSKNPARLLYERVGFETIEHVPSLIFQIESGAEHGHRIPKSCNRRT